MAFQRGEGSIGAFRKKVRTDADVRAAFESQPLDVPDLYDAVLQPEFLGHGHALEQDRLVIAWG